MSRREAEQILTEHEAWIESQRAGQVPRLGLDRLHVSEPEARVAARELASALVDDEAERLGLAYGRIRIGDQRSLWGSCSPNGSLSFNWRLVLAPLEVFDYVAVHELCHRLIPNHSSSFWKLVERQRPRWRESREWLRVHGSELHAFRPGR
jgi:predicted metal-dependent hydrolase